MQQILDILIKDLDRLSAELDLYTNEEQLWLVASGITNSAGNLALHITGNLQHFIGMVLGQTGYQRDRPGEFNRKHVPLNELHNEVMAAKQAINAALPLTSEEMQQPYPLAAGFGPEGMTNAYALVHLTAHLSYHLGQINYHRRLLG